MRMPTVWEAEAIRGQEIAQGLAHAPSYDAARQGFDALPPDDQRAIGLYAIYVQRMVAVIEQEDTRRHWLAT